MALLDLIPPEFQFGFDADGSPAKRVGFRPINYYSKPGNLSASNFDLCVPNPPKPIALDPKVYMAEGFQPQETTSREWAKISISVKPTMLYAVRPEDLELVADNLQECGFLFDEIEFLVGDFGCDVSWYKFDTPISKDDFVPSDSLKHAHLILEERKVLLQIRPLRHFMPMWDWLPPETASSLFDSFFLLHIMPHFDQNYTLDKFKAEFLYFDTPFTLQNVRKKMDMFSKQTRKHASSQDTLVADIKPEPKFHDVGDAAHILTNILSATRTTEDKEWKEESLTESDRSDDFEKKKPKKRKGHRSNYPPKVQSELMNWLELNRDHPYPNDQQKRQMSRELGLSIQQISNWFINARRRYL
ncbi:hypothetical protein EDD86DRAFT_235311 [Gorgonomyces haynaldii]|nr:hypothetical protein EDD86DRAFT_235311 [Gorgonomyces haynaldii]